MKRHIVFAWKCISPLLLILKDCKGGGGGNMLLLTIVLLFQLSHFVDTNISLPLVVTMSELDIKKKNNELDVSK
jgi:hypothetical protein